MDEHGTIEELYESLSPEERRDRIILAPAFRDAYNEITEAHRVIQVPKYFWDKWVPTLGPVAATLYMRLRQYCYYNPQTGERRDWCWPKQSTLAREIGIRDRKTLRKSLTLLEEHGFIRRERTVHRATHGQIRRGTDKYFVYFEIPLVTADAVTLLIKESTTLKTLDIDHKGKKSSYGDEAHEELDHKGKISLSAAREKIPSQRSTESTYKNVTNVGLKPVKEGLHHHPAVTVLTEEERSSREGLALRIGDELKALSQRRDVAPHGSEGFHRRVAAILGPKFVAEALTATRDAVEDSRAGRRKLKRGPDAYFAGVVRKIADREGIDLGVAWKDEV